MPGQDLALEYGNLRAKAAPLLGQDRENRADLGRQMRVFQTLDHHQQRGKPGLPFLGDDPQLGQMAADRVGEPGALLDQQLAGAMGHQRGLVGHAFQRHKLHARPAHRLATGRRIDHVVLAAPFDPGLRRGRL